MKVVFLDIDGVLNSEDEIKKAFGADLDDPDAPSPVHLQWLKKILDETGAEVVLSSSWRIGLRSTQIVMDSLASIGYSLRGVTPEGVSVSFIEKSGFKPTRLFLETRGDTKYTLDRGAEIYAWLNKHPEVTNFVILDDEDTDIKGYFPDKLVKTSFAHGLLEEHAKKAVKILNNL